MIYIAYCSFSFKALRYSLETFVCFLMTSEFLKFTFVFLTSRIRTLPKMLQQKLKYFEKEKSF